MLLCCNNKSKTFKASLKNFQNILSGPALLHSLVCDVILGMDKKKKKKKKTKRDDKLLGFIGVLSGTSMLHEGDLRS